MDAKASMALSFSDCVRQVLQAPKIWPPAVQTCLQGLKCLSRYEKRFPKFRAFCSLHGAQFCDVTLPQGAGYLLQFAGIFPSESKFVYASLLKIPGWDQLKYSPV